MKTVLPLTIKQDNQCAIALAEKDAAHTRSKHIDIKHHFIREKIANKIIKLEYCPTDNMIADTLTKPLSREKFEKFRLDLGLRVPFEGDVKDKLVT